MQQHFVFVAQDFGQITLGGFAPADRADKDVVSHQVIVATSQFLEAAIAGRAKELHLPPAILCLNVTLSEQEIVHTAGVDVRDAPIIAPDGDGVLQPGDLHFAVECRQRAARQIVEEDEAADQYEDEDQQQSEQNIS